ncbi:MAG: arginase [Candidatus Eisenbacteria bacterium]
MRHSCSRTWEIVGAPFELGAPEPGSAGAPLSIREAGLSSLVRGLPGHGLEGIDSGDVGCPEGEDGDSRPKNLPQLVEFADAVMERLDDVYARGATPVVLGGDHSVSIPSVTSAARHLRSGFGEDAELGLIWVDAHPDLETPESSPSGYCHGMAGAALMGIGAVELTGLGGFSPKVRPANMVLIGLRDVLRAERALIEELGVMAYTASDVERLGMAEVCARSFTHMESATSGFVVSFDMDACDPLEAPGVDYPEPGGLTFREARLLAECAAEAPGLLCIEVVEVNPRLDREARSSKLAVGFIRAAMLGSPLAPASGDLGGNA